MKPGPCRRRHFKSNLPLLLHRPGLFCRVDRWPLILLLIGTILDAATTYVALRDYGPGAEVHPAVQLLMRILGVSPWSMSAVKVAQSSCALLTASLWRPWCGFLLGLAGVLYILAAISNHFVLL